MEVIKMKRIFRLIFSVILSFNFIFGLCACHMAESYKEFNIVNITDRSEKDYFDSDDLGFSRIKGIVIVPEVKEIDWGKYIVYIAAYSEEKMEQITVKNVKLICDGNKFFDEKIDQNIILEINQDNVYEGDVVGGIFTDDEVDISNGKEIFMQVQVQVGDESDSQEKTINYEIHVTIYKSLVTPV